MKKHRIMHVPPLRFGIVLAVINGFAGMILAPIFLITLGLAFTATETGVVVVPKVFPAVPWFVAWLCSLRSSMRSAVSWPAC